jgi:hypothetical protein
MPIYTFVNNVALSHLEILSATVNAWTYKYEGDAHILLLKTLLKMSDDKATYRKVLPLCQSSGMGKSRAVDELRKLVFTLPFNFRQDDDAGCA